MDEGFIKGHEAGYEQGYEAGRRVGFFKGYNAGRQDVMDEMNTSHDDEVSGEMSGQGHVPESVSDGGGTSESEMQDSDNKGTEHSSEFTGVSDSYATD